MIIIDMCNVNNSFKYTNINKVNYEKLFWHIQFYAYGPPYMCVARVVSAQETSTELGVMPWITGQLVALVISSPRTAGQLVAKSKIQLVNSSPNVVALILHDLCVWK